MPALTLLLLIMALPLSFADVAEEDTICRDGMALIKRTQYNDYVCTIESTAIKWSEYGIGEIVGFGLNHPSLSIPQEDELSKDNESPYFLKLSRTNVPAKIPLHKGYYDGDLVYFIITDSSEKSHADIISKQQKWRVELAPSLVDVPDNALSRTYMFTNGIKGGGIHGFQGEVFTSTPNSDDYSPLTMHIHVTWHSGSSPFVLDSEDEVLLAVAEGHVSLSELSVVLNMPQIIWPGGQMMIKEDKTISNETPFGGGQLINIDKNGMTATFVAHRGWGPDGRTLYYILVDGTPSEETESLGLVSVPNHAFLAQSSSTNDIFQFKNGINSTSGMLGFQPAVTIAAPGDSGYSPMCKTSLVEWIEPEESFILASYNDLAAFKKDGLVRVEQYGQSNSDYIMNCPIVDPFQ